MARKARGQPIHGWIVLDKPPGMTSSRAVVMLRRLTDAAKAGHGGTLDPLATGVLPVALGEATKTIAYAMAGRKVYRFTLRWGEARDTDDADGQVVAISAVRPTREAILGALPAFCGAIDQRPPDYSAIKVAGERAYDLARQGMAPELAARRVMVDRLDLLDMTDPDTACFEAEVGKGTYIRALARDLGRALGSYAHIAALRRLSVGQFTLDKAISLDKLAALGHNLAASEHLLRVETALDDIPALAVTEEEVRALRHGRSVTPWRPSDRARIGAMANGATILATSKGRLVALASVEAGFVRPVRVMNF